MKDKICKICGCDFPNNEYSDTGCLYCQSLEDSIHGSMLKLKRLLNEHDRLTKGDKDEE